MAEAQTDSAARLDADSPALCGCEACSRLRRKPNMLNPLQIPGWRYCCEICSNKRCPHHADHRFACTNSNATGQVGVLGDEAALQAQREAVAAERAKRAADVAQDAADLEAGRAWRRLRDWLQKSNRPITPSPWVEITLRPDGSASVNAILDSVDRSMGE